MLNVKINPHHNGACPHCKKESRCKILDELKKTAHKTVRQDRDDAFELVIYRCPEFEAEN